MKTMAMVLITDDDHLPFYQNERLFFKAAVVSG